MNWLRRLRWGPLTRDRCEVCGKKLRVRDRVEVTEILEVTDLGGSAMTATFCKQDAPKETP